MRSLELPPPLQFFPEGRAKVRLFESPEGNDMREHQTDMIATAEPGFRKHAAAQIN